MFGLVSVVVLALVSRRTSAFGGVLAYVCVQVVVTARKHMNSSIIVSVRMSMRIVTVVSVLVMILESLSVFVFECVLYK